MPGTAAGFAVEVGGLVMEGTAREFLRTLETCFADLKDSRGQASCDHRLIDILAISILAVTCGIKRLMTRSKLHPGKTWDNCRRRLENVAPGGRKT